MAVCASQRRHRVRGDVCKVGKGNGGHNLEHAKNPQNSATRMSRWNLGSMVSKWVITYK